MENCSDVDMSKEQVDELVSAMFKMIEEGLTPATILEYLSSELGFPEEDDNEYCTIECVSSCLYKFYKVTNTEDDIFAYVTVDRTQDSIIECFPKFESFPCNGGEMDSSSRGCSKNVDESRKNCALNNAGMLALGLAFLAGKLSDLFEMLFEKCISYIKQIKIKDKHLITTVMADLTKKIGGSLEKIAKAWKSIKDMINSSINWAFSVKEVETDNGQPTENHFKKAIQDAMTTVQGYITDIMKDIGGFIEQIGEYLNDWADQTEDIEHIEFAWKSLNGTIRKAIDYVQNIFSEQYLQQLTSDIYDSMSDSINAIKKKYTDQMDALVRSVSLDVDIAINNPPKFMEDAIENINANHENINIKISKTSEIKGGGDVE